MTQEQQMLEPQEGIDQPSAVDQQVNAEPVSEPQGQTTGETARTQETPEDIAKSRAHFQTKAQTETERRKQVEAELSEIYRKLDEYDPQVKQQIVGDLGMLGDDAAQLQYYQQQQQQPQYQYPQPQPQQQFQAKQPEFEETDDPYLNEIRRGIGELRKEFMTKEQQREQAAMQERQRQLYSQWQNESKNAATQVTNYVEKYEIPDDVSVTAAKEATYYVPDLNQLGAPTRRARLIMRHLQEWVVSQKHQDSVNQRIAQDGQRIQDMAMTAQPVGASPGNDISQAGDWNKQQADLIAPDDPQVFGPTQ